MASQAAVNMNFFAVILLKCWAGYIEFPQFEITGKDLLIV
jgi:hypothetical protein